MVIKRTNLKLADNSGPKKIKCLKIKTKNIGYISDVITVIIKKKFIRNMGVIFDSMTNDEAVLWYGVTSGINAVPPLVAFLALYSSNP